MSNSAQKNLKVVIAGQPLSIQQVASAARSPLNICVELDSDLQTRMQVSVDLVASAVRQNQSIYGVTTGFGGMSGVQVTPEHSAASQKNLLAFLATGAGAPIDDRHTRAAMLLRANVLAQGCSGIRYELVRRLATFVEAGATPVVRDLGSIGASGDLVPLSVIARAITGQTGFVEVRLPEGIVDGPAALQKLGLDPLDLLPKEGLALVNGTSFSAAIAANCVYEARPLMALALAVQALCLQALMCHEDPFDDFVHQKKPHPGQQWTAAMMLRLLREGRSNGSHRGRHVQDRYSLRCLPQYMGSIVEGLARIIDVVETEMNAVSDNPLIDVDSGRFYQSGNFLGQYLGLAMDDLRRFLGLLAKHLDVQIATLVAPELGSELPASLQGNAAVPYNMGLKGLQITGNSIMPLLTWYGHPIVEHFPTHAEQFNQNINGLSWGSANLAWKSVNLFQHYLSVAMIFSVQALDLRAHSLLGHYDGRALLGSLLSPLYSAVYRATGRQPGDQQPFVFNDQDHWLERDLASLAQELQNHGSIVQAVVPILESFDARFLNSHLSPPDSTV